MTEQHKHSQHVRTSQAVTINYKNANAPHLCITIRWCGAPPPAAVAEVGEQPC